MLGSVSSALTWIKAAKAATESNIRVVFILINIAAIETPTYPGGNRIAVQGKYLFVWKPKFLVIGNYILKPANPSNHIVAVLIPLLIVLMLNRS